MLPDHGVFSSQEASALLAGLYPSRHSDWLAWLMQ